ncbi:MAG: formate dehydrogenase accessory sulfurtransferase FdhD [Thermodesulfovibrionia bacterium]|nr:formate dehydrogenase accessory sulfurtransferase FdhD [Thermodesulfovibrionia bacterium]
MKGYKKKIITKITESHNSVVEDAVAEERRLRILINGKEALKMYCSPIMIRELVAGFLTTEGIVNGGWCAERMSIQYDEEIVVDVPVEGEVHLEGGAITSGCVGGMTFERPLNEDPVQAVTKIEKDKLRDLFRKFQTKSDLYNMTGCIHSAAISDGDHIIVCGEDIGRHNAVDKVLGYCVLEQISLQDKIILVSGRLSSEMVAKCARWSIPIVVSRAAPTALAINIAEKRGITMIGFMRGKRLNIYTHPDRVLG